MTDEDEDAIAAELEAILMVLNCINVVCYIQYIIQGEIPEVPSTNLEEDIQFPEVPTREPTSKGMYVMMIVQYHLLLLLIEPAKEKKEKKLELA